MRSPITGVDRRPRIHLWPEPTGASFSFGPCGNRVRAESVGQAVEVALDAAGRAPAVIIYEGVVADSTTGAGLVRRAQLEGVG